MSVWVTYSFVRLCRFTNNPELYCFRLVSVTWEWKKRITTDKLAKLGLQVKNGEKCLKAVFSWLKNDDVINEMCTTNLNSTTYYTRICILIAL